MDSILLLDQQLFNFINQGLQNSFFDVILPLVRNKYIWYPLYVYVIGYSLVTFKRPESYLIVMCLFIAVMFSDLMSSQIIKKSVQRDRPCNELMLDGQVENRVRCSHGYSFPSSHATNHFCMALSIILLFGIKRLSIKSALIAWAAIISFAQIYVGVHYPIDVLFGVMLGVFCAYFAYKIFFLLGILVIEVEGKEELMVDG